MTAMQSAPSPRQAAVSRVAAGASIEDTAQHFNIPVDRLRRWVGARDDDGASGNRTRRGKQATILDLAEHTGLSKSVVSRALRGQYGVSPDAQARVAAAVEELGYVSNAAAQNLSAYRTNTIGVLVRDASAPFYGEMQSALQKRGSTLGQRVFITSGALDNNDERRALEDLIALRVDGLIVCSGRLPLKEVKRFSTKFPVVVAGRPDIDPAVDSVFGDEDEGARQLADHLVDLGHQRVAVFQPPTTVSPILHRRIEVMRYRLEERGAEALVVATASPDEARELLSGLPSGVSAVMCPNDRYAAAVLLELRTGARPLSVTGFDGVGGLASALIDLTTWRQPIADIGAAAVERLLHLVTHRNAVVDHLAIAGRLHIGTTTAPPA
ncbi:substrate-binding domain-containing protein [Microbacterium sp. Clip185]|uniref:substrate-binding domain-containing protein n=1 Tax=Microbacterium sp. Clip185 TaxID=3025663 RepID=UPI002366681D|nr:substrate-binding domain-containing protein [Microbacterium sp. Clip185]WDG18044.1 substrate-binding domain-containing protein [Microbacterium sp. Clip185]